MKRVTAGIVVCAAVLCLAAGEAAAARRGSQLGTTNQQTQTRSLGTSAQNGSSVYARLCEMQAAVDQLRSCVNGTDQDRAQKRLRDCDLADPQDALQDRLRQRQRICDPTVDPQPLRDRTQRRLRDYAPTQEPTYDRIRTRDRDYAEDPFWGWLWRWGGE